MAITAEYDVNIEVANVGNIAIAPGKITEIAGVSTQGTFGVGTVVAQTNELLIPSTSATTLATFTPTANGPFIILSYFTVNSGTVTVTLTYTWHDSLASQTATIVNSVSENTGAYSITPYMLSADTSSAINVTVTVGTANQVTASSTIIAL